MNITFNDYDPFADDVLLTEKIHLRIKSRNQRKGETVLSNTTPSVLSDDSFGALEIDDD